MTARTWPSRAALRAGQVFLAMVCLFLVIRGIVEFFTVNPSRPASYRNDWGGPHYLGVIAVHSGPGILIMAAVCWYVVERRRVRHS